MSVITYTAKEAARDHAERNARFLKVNGREYTFDDWLKEIGGRHLGQSLVLPHQQHGRTVLVEDL